MMFNVFEQIEILKQKSVELSIKDALEEFGLSDRSEGAYLEPEKKKEVYDYLVNRFKFYMNEMGVQYV